MKKTAFAAGILLVRATSLPAQTTAGPEITVGHIRCPTVEQGRPDSTRLHRDSTGTLRGCRTYFSGAWSPAAPQQPHTDNGVPDGVYINERTRSTVCLPYPYAVARTTAAKPVP